MSASEEHDPTPAGHPAGRERRRKTMVAGVTGVALTLGAASYLITGALLADQRRVAPETAAIAPAAPPEPAASASAASPSPSGTATQSPRPSRKEEETTTEPRGRNRDGAGRQAAEQTRRQTDPPLTAEQMPVNSATEKLSNATVQIMAAEFDMTGMGHLRWAGDAGSPAGDARCTRSFRFDPAKPAKEQPSMLLCWHTSADRSVVAMAYGKPDERPSTEETVRLVDQHWARLG